MKERQEIHCHACKKWVQFDIDTDLDGKHVLDCPNCGHAHCRFVDNGNITDRRWDQRNGDLPVYIASPYTSTTSSASSYTFFSTGSIYLHQSWLNTTST